MNLSFKVSATMLLVLTTAMTVSGWLSVSEERRVLGEIFRDQGKHLAHDIAVFSIEALLAEDYPVLNTFLETAGKDREDILSIEVWQKGDLVSAYRAAGLKDEDVLVFESDVLFEVEEGRRPIKLGQVRVVISDRENRLIIASRIRESVTHTVIIFILLSGTLLLAMRKVVLNKIKKLGDHARQIGSGRLDLKIDLRTGDELGKLAQTLNEMVTRIKRSQEELRHHQEHLESLVKERTRELEEAQEEMVSKAMEAGRAQLAAMVLHNIGNAMTPINVQIEALKAGRGTDVAQYLEKCYQDLEANAGNLETYINADPRGKEVFNYMGELIAALTAEENRNGEALEKMDRAVSYVSEILVMQQAYASGDQEYRERVDLNILINDAIQIQMDRLERKGITVEQKLEVPLPRVLIEKNRLMQVLMNLIVNGSEAFESLDPGDHQKKIRVKTFADNGHVGFEIEDNGIGIDQENIEHIFDFGKSYQRSTGLGLYYCKLFLEDNGGTLSISSSQSGVGTTVRAVFKKHA